MAVFVNYGAMVSWKKDVAQVRTCALPTASSSSTSSKTTSSSSSKRPPLRLFSSSKKTEWLRRSVVAFRTATETADVRALFRHHSLQESLFAQMSDSEAGVETVPILPCAVVFLLTLVRAAQRMTAVIPNIQSIPSWMYRRGRTLRGRVVAVPDGDNFVMIHAPRFSFFPRNALLGKQKTDLEDCLSGLSFQETIDNYIRIRLAGIDAPEGAFCGGAGQPYHKEAMEYLKENLLGKTVTVKLLGRDRYARAIAIVYKGWGPNRRNINADMLEEGLATIYWGVNRRYGDCFQVFRQKEGEARSARRRIWSVSNGMRPWEYKRRLAEAPKQVATSGKDEQGSSDATKSSARRATNRSTTATRSPSQKNRSSRTRGGGRRRKTSGTNRTKTIRAAADRSSAK